MFERFFIGRFNQELFHFCLFAWFDIRMDKHSKELSCNIRAHWAPSFPFLEKSIHSKLIDDDHYFSGSSESISTDGSSDSITSPLIPRDSSIPQGPIEQVFQTIYNSWEYQLHSCCDLQSDELLENENNSGFRWDCQGKYQKHYHFRLFVGKAS